MKNLKQVLEVCRRSMEYDFHRGPLVDVDQRGESGDRPLHVFSMRGDLDAVQVLLAGGANISATGEMENTALFSAIMGGNIDVVKYLVEQGCPLNYRNENGKTAL